MEYETYITRKEACFQSECGPISIPFGTELTAKDGTIYDMDGRPLCCSDSQQARDVFCQNDDGQGLERGVLLNRIEAQLEKPDGWSRKRWVEIWSDDLCQKYRQCKPTDQDWVWNPDFYNAPLEDLRHIATLIGVQIESV